LIDAGSIMSYLDIDGNPFRREISSAISQLHSFGDKSKDIDTRINALSNSMKTMGLSLTKHVTTPLVGLGQQQ